MTDGNKSALPMVTIFGLKPCCAACAQKTRASVEIVQRHQLLKLSLYFPTAFVPKTVLFLLSMTVTAAAPKPRRKLTGHSI